MKYVISLFYLNLNSHSTSVTTFGFIDTTVSVILKLLSDREGWERI